MPQTITLILSVIGTLGTIYSLIHNIYANRVKLNCMLKYINFGNSYLVGYIVVENQSLSSVSITNIELIIDDDHYYFMNQPHWVIHNQTKQGNNQSESYVYSMQIPFTLSSYGATGGYILAHSHTVPNLDKVGILRIGTNRNKTLEFSIQLCDIPHQEHFLFR